MYNSEHGVKQLYCCSINCGRPAVWEITHGDNPTPDDHTQSCNIHISDLLTDADNHQLHFIGYHEKSNNSI